MNVIAPRFARLLACAAVPAMVIISGSAASASPHSGQQESRASRSVPAPASAPHAADYKTLPNPCKAISQHTVHQMVPNANDPNGMAFPTKDPKHERQCDWQGGPDDQWHSMSPKLMRFDSVPGGASGRDRAEDAYQREVQRLVESFGQKATSLSGLGDQANLLTVDRKEDGYPFHAASVVVRSANAVVFVYFDATGATGVQAAKMNKLAQQAASEALASLKRKTSSY